MASHANFSGHPLSRSVNCLVLAGLCAMLLLAFAGQVYFSQPPSPVHLLQRAALILAGVGLLLNIRFGAAAKHYGLIIVSALGGIVVAGRQVLPHISTGKITFGDPLVDSHFSIWALLAFGGLIAFCGIVLLFERFTPQYAAMPRARLMPGLITWLFLLLVAGNAASTMLQCGFGACPDNPTGYLWLQSRG